MSKGRLFILYICFIMGIILFILGIVQFSQNVNKKESIQTTAIISDIVKITNEENEIIQHVVYVEFAIEEELYEIKLNSYSTKYNVGDSIEIYYFPDNLTIVYAEGSQYIMLGYSVVGLLVSSICFIVYFLNKKKASKEA